MQRYKNKLAYLYEGEICFDEQDLVTVFKDNLKDYKQGRRPDVIKQGLFNGHATESDLASGTFEDELGRRYDVSNGRGKLLQDR